MKQKIFLFGVVLLMIVLMLGGCQPTPPAPADESQTPDTPAVSETVAGSPESESEVASETASETVSETVSETTTETETDAPEDNVLRFGVMSDTHIGNALLKGNMRKSLEALKTVSDGRLDLMLVPGDLTDTTANDPISDQQIKTFRQIYVKTFPDLPLVYCLGSSHDLPPAGDCTSRRQLYKDVLGGFEHDLSPDTYVESGVRHVEIEGYHIFSVDYAPTQAGKNAMVQAITALTEENADKPIFVIVHNGSDAAITSILAPFPQVIAFSGHFHNSLAREDAITQEMGFTSMLCGGTAYYRVDGYNRFLPEENPFLALGDIYQFAQNLYVEVSEDHTVTVKRVDAINNVVIGEPWVISPDRRDVYTDERRVNAEPCVFSEDARLTVEESGESTVKVSFDAATMGDAGPALYYRVELIGKDEQGRYMTLQTADLGSQQVFYPNDVGIPKGHYRHTFTDVDLTDYAVVVSAYDCWQISGNRLLYSSGSYEYGAGNAALGKKVIVTEGASMYHAEYSPDMLTDGLFGYYSNNPTRLRGWNKAEGFLISEENPIDITIDLGDLYEINSVVIHPIVSYNNVFPTYFEYQVSTSADGDDWITVKELVDVECNGRLSGSAPLEDYDPENYYKVTFDEAIEVRRFRLHITTPSPAPNGEDCYMGFGEIELWSEKGTVQS